MNQRFEIRMAAGMLNEGLTPANLCEMIVGCLESEASEVDGFRTTDPDKGLLIRFDLLADPCQTPCCECPHAEPNDGEAR